MGVSSLTCQVVVNDCQPGLSEAVRPFHGVSLCGLVGVPSQHGGWSTSVTVPVEHQIEHVTSIMTQLSKSHHITSVATGPPKFRKGNIDATSQWEECQGHSVRGAGGMKDTVAVVFAKYNLPHLVRCFPSTLGSASLT